MARPRGGAVLDVTSPRSQARCADPLVLCRSARGTFLLAGFMMLSLFLVLAGCGLMECDPLKSRKAVVRLKGKVNLAVPCPVTLNGVAIGKVNTATLDDQGQPELRICLDKSTLKTLTGVPVFYVAHTEAGDALVAEPQQGTPLPSEGDLVFLGFDSYQRYLSWRTEHLLKKGVENLMGVLNEALQ